MNGKAALLPVAAAGGIGLLFGAGLILDPLSSTEEADVSAPRTPTEQIEVVPPAPSEPVFQGELLGIKFADEQILQEQGILKLDPCPTTDLALLNIPGEGPNVPPAPLYLPPGAYMPTVKQGALADAPNPGTNWCPDTGVVYSAWRYYEIPNYPSGAPGHIFIAQDFARPYTTAPYRRSELEQVTLAGRPAIFVGPSEEVEAQPYPYDAIFLIPEGQGLIQLRTFGVSQEEAIKIAESFVQVLVQKQPQ